MGTRCKAGWLLIAGAALLFLVGETWLRTREPVSLKSMMSAGAHTIETDAFRVTYSTDYFLALGSVEDEWPPLKARWTLLCDGKARSSGSIGENSTWAFIPEPTGADVCHLKLDVDSAHGLLSVRVGATGASLEYIRVNVVLYSSAFFSLGCVFLLLRIPENKPSRVLRLALYGLLASTILIPLVIVMTLPDSEHVSYGIWLKPPPRNYDYRWKPLVLRIESDSRWTLDGAPVSQEQLPEMLRRCFRDRPDWVLRLEANPELEMQLVVRVVDRLQGLGIRTVVGGSSKTPEPRGRMVAQTPR